MKEAFYKKIWPIVKKHKILRTLSLLSIIFILFVPVFLMMSFSYNQKIKANQNQIEKNQKILEGLKQTAASDQIFDNDLFQRKSFADYSEVIPFIAFLENLFSAIDPKNEITIKGAEDQIFLDHFADYTIGLKLKKQKKDLFFRALDELNRSRFIIKLMNFEIQYKPTEEGERNELKDVEFVTRLFLK